jgi:hypothetical protein
MTYLPRKKLKLLSGLLPYVPASDPESAQEPSVNEIRASPGSTGSFFSPYP